MESIIKINRDVFILSILSERPMSGYDLIKEIFHRYDVFLNQGSVYPVSYALEEDGTLKAEFHEGNKKPKLYSLTPEGREIAQKRLCDFTEAMEAILDSTSRRDKYA